MEGNQMLSVASDCANTTVHVSSICDIAKLLNKSDSAIYGPSVQQMSEYDALISEWKSEIEKVKSVATILNAVRAKFQPNVSLTEQDAPELLQISAGFAIAMQNQVKARFEVFGVVPLVKTQRKQLQNIHKELIVHLEKLSDNFLSFRHVILYSRGQATEFRASKKALLSLVESANNTNGTGDFVEA
jgi:hypothetical protein